MTAAERIKQMEGRHWMTIGGFVGIAGLLLTCFGWLANSSRAAGVREEQLAEVVLTVKGDLEPRLRIVEGMSTKNTAEHAEIMRMLERIEAAQKER